MRRAISGADLSRPPRRWTDDERDRLFNPAAALAVFDTPEVADQSGYALAAVIRSRIMAEKTGRGPAGRRR